MQCEGFQIQDITFKNFGLNYNIQMMELKKTSLHFGENIKRKLISFQSKNKGSQEEEHFIFAVGEAIFVGWFTFEYIIRFIAAPQKWK